MSPKEESLIRSSCTTAGLPREVAEFLIREGASAGKVIRAASAFRTAVIRGGKPSVLSVLTEATDATTAQKFSEAPPIGGGASHASSARKTVEELWAEVVDEINAENARSGVAAS
jgi:hypothetical protein